MSAPNSKSGRVVAAFFGRRPVFTHAEFVQAHTAQGRSALTSNKLLAKHLAGGRIVRVQRGLYASVPAGVDPQRVLPDPYLIAGAAVSDAVLAYHTALAFHGKAYSLWRRFQFLTASRRRSFEFRGQEFVPVQAPRRVRELPDFGGGVVLRPHAGGSVRVSTLERALVDVLDAPAQGGGWEEIWRSLEMVEFFDLAAVVDYSVKLGSAITAARVGFVLDRHRREWMVEEQHLEPLRRLAPDQPRYFGTRRESGRLVKGWNLIVPETVLGRTWEEPA
jgi:predicted transcriptional regulator of viral defense system